VDLTGLDQLLWATSFAGHWILLAVLVLRRRARSFPVFTSLIAVNIVRTIVLFFTLRLGSSESYFYVYWTLAIVDVGFQLAIAYELASKVFRPLGAWASDVRKSSLAMAAASVAIAGGMTWLAAPPTRTLRLAIVIRGDFFASALMSELFVAMVALSVTLGLPWRTHVARVAQGLGVYSIYGIFTDAAYSYFGSSGVTHGTYALLSQLQNALYLGCIGYWSVTLAIREPEPRKMPEQLHDELRRLQSRAALMLKSLRTLRSAS
jgi:hypothetical protein